MNRIRQLREERNMTQSELAALMNTNYQTISDYEREKYYPGIEFLRLLAHYFNTSIDYLLCETDVRDPYMSAREHYLTPKESEKQKLYILLAKAKGSGVPIPSVHAIIEQSEKIDSLVIKFQSENRHG